MNISYDEALVYFLWLFLGGKCVLEKNHLNVSSKNIYTDATRMNETSYHYFDDLQAAIDVMKHQASDEG